VLTRALVCSSGSVSACLNVVGPLSVAVVINQNLEHGGLLNLPNRDGGHVNDSCPRYRRHLKGIGYRIFCLLSHARASKA